MLQRPTHPADPSQKGAAWQCDKVEGTEVLLTTASSGKPVYKPVAMWGAFADRDVGLSFWCSLSCLPLHAHLPLSVLHPWQCSFPSWLGEALRGHRHLLPALVICHHGGAPCPCPGVGRLLPGSGVLDTRCQPLSLSGLSSWSGRQLSVTAKFKQIASQMKYLLLLYFRFVSAFSNPHFS